MSSTIRILRICQHCQSEFTARTTVTQYCNDTCAKRAYKARKRGDKIEKSDAETTKIKSFPIEQIKAKEFLSVRDICVLLGASRPTVYRLINSGKLTAFKISTKKTIIKRTDIDKLFQPSI